MRHRVRALVGLAFGWDLAGCASVPRSVIAPPQADPLALIRQGDAELERGCYLCLRSAAVSYEKAIREGASARTVLPKAAGAWLLVAAREKEVGLKPSGAMELARTTVARMDLAGPSDTRTREFLDTAVRLVRGLPPRPEGASPEALAEAAKGRPARTRAEILSGHDESHPAWLTPVILLAQQTEDQAATYLARSWSCAMGGKREGENDSFLAGETPLLAYRKATCSDRGGGAVEAKALEDLLAGEPRFHEVHFFMGRLALSEGKLAAAEREFFAAADGLPQSVAAWAMLAAVRLALDDSDAAAADFGRALSLEPNLPASLLGQARALNYLGRFEEALPPAQKLVDGGVWYQSDANYWLAFAEFQLGKLAEADRHVREAKRTNSADGDTARLAGLIAQRLGEFDRAQSEFELALSRNDADCEARLHLGQIHGVQERWGDSVASFVRARGCYLSQEALLEEKAPGIRSSDLSEARKQIALARLANRVEAARRSQAASSLGAAEGETQRGAKEQALAYLAEAWKDPSLSARVAELRRRLGAKVLRTPGAWGPAPIRTRRV